MNVGYSIWWNKHKSIQESVKLHQTSNSNTKWVTKFKKTNSTDKISSGAQVIDLNQKIKNKNKNLN